MVASLNDTRPQQQQKYRRSGVLNRVFVTAGAAMALICALGSESSGVVTTAMAGCAADTDCVPSTCCHPTSCVEKSRAPVCGATAEEQARQCDKHDECTPFSLDCGGHCFCTALGECGAIVNMGQVGKKQSAEEAAQAANFMPMPVKAKRVKYTYGYARVRGPPKKKHH